MSTVENDALNVVVLGGSRGLGEAIVLEMLERGSKNVVVVDRVAPRFDNPKVRWRCLDLALDDVCAISSFIDEADVLIITAGVGRLDYFDNFDMSEIALTLRVNAMSVIEVLQLCSRRLTSERPFHVAVFTSIAGLVSSPFYAIYSASKSAVSRYIEAVNAELAGRGLPNRILEVAPGRIEGTGFHGAPPEAASKHLPLAAAMVDAMFRGQTRFIPDADIYEAVIANYHENPAAFAESSFRYKLKNAAFERRKKAVLGYLSGTFDLFHIGHLNLLRRARSMCDRLVVGVHESGAWKGKETFISLAERKEIIAGCRYVDQVIDAPEEDDVAWDLLRYDRLFVGSDYKGTERFERYEQVLGAKNVEIVYFPYTKGTSSTQLRNAIESRS